MALELDDALTAYGQAWVETDRERRLAILETCWSETGRYLDPNGSAQGRTELADLIGSFHQQMPGARIELASRASAHHARIYFHWKMVTAEGQTALEGVDFGTLAEDGRIDEIVGFFGPPPNP
ncbi:nuclear transport factor 2 family protein [Candidatus Rhodobacter oscarellae]|uniref:nuclear transport factor 2 family protein n=1 Tax=Candidatus Rhodobacter oscarellae TaxID=1675527 RepID=UPI0009E25B0F|nr:nuclear transport factor 2 family protein [Candidatus Rhodobacter lobularis]